MGARESWVFHEEVSTYVLAPVLRGVCVVVGGEVGDDDCLPWAGAPVYRHWCSQRFRGYVDGVGGGRRYRVSLCLCDGSICLDGEEEVVAVRR